MYLDLLFCFVYFLVWVFFFFLVMYLFKYLAHFLIGLFIFLLLSFENICFKREINWDLASKLKRSKLNSKKFPVENQYAGLVTPKPSALYTIQRHGLRTIAEKKRRWSQCARSWARSIALWENWGRRWAITGGLEYSGLPRNLFSPG